MPRTSNGVARKAKINRILDKAKGMRGGRSKLYRTARSSVLKAEIYNTRDRRKNKGEFRRLWITRISAALHGTDLNYSRFMGGLKKANIEIDRKQLSELAIHNPGAFAAIVEKAKAALAA